MSDNTLPKGKNIKCRRGSRDLKKGSEPSVNNISEIFSSILNLSDFPPRPPRRSKLSTNHADFVQKNAEVHQMVLETSSLQNLPNVVKKQRRKKNVSTVQNQEAGSAGNDGETSSENQETTSFQNKESVSIQSQQIPISKSATFNAGFDQNNSEIHEMVETSGLQNLPKKVKRQRRKKNASTVQTQVFSSRCKSLSPENQETASLQTEEIVLKHTQQIPMSYADFVENNSEIYQTVEENSDSKKSPKRVRKPRKKKNISTVQNQDLLSDECQNHISLENRETISIQNQKFSLQSQQIISNQRRERNPLETLNVSAISASTEINESGSSSQKESISEIKKKRKRTRKSKVLPNISSEESSSVQGQSAGNSSIEVATSKTKFSRTFTRSDPEAKSNSKRKPKIRNEEEAISPEKEKKESEKEKFPTNISKQDVLKLLENQPKDNPTFVEGNLRINVKFYKHAYVPVPDNEMDILIVGLRDRNRALEGDIVAVCINPKDKWHTHSTNEVQKTGTVVCILEKNHPRKAVGFIKKYQNGIIFHPRDSRIPLLKVTNPQLLPAAFHENPKPFENTLFLAKMTTWKKPGYAFGKLKQNVGNTGDLTVETNAILLENDLNVNPFEDALLKNLPFSGYTPTGVDLEGREDWTNHCIFTIDPASAQDLDDAVSCQPLVNGNFEVGVHIADVTHFLKAFTPLDERVSDRATTVYLVDNVYHMLPKQLCEVCSLKPGQDKLAFSVIWEMTPSAEIVNQRFAKTVINSCCQMSYEQAQAMIENPLNDWSMDSDLDVKRGFEASQLCEIVNDLFKLSLQLREKRFEDGALRIDQPKLCISLDRETGLPISCSIEENKDSNRLVEEFMLLANMAVAKQIYDTIPQTALLRSHREPSNRILTQTRDMLEKFGVILDTESSGALQKSLKQYESESAENFAAKCRMLVINSLCARSMTIANMENNNLEYEQKNGLWELNKFEVDCNLLQLRAIYRCSNSVKNENDLRHYALSVPLYTHFTSPIRRYPDCIVHRLLYASIRNDKLPSQWNSLLCAKMAANCNVKKYSAKVAQEQSSELFFAYLLDMRGPTIVQAVVMDVKDRSIDVIIIDVGLKTRIYLADVEEEMIAEFSGDHFTPTIKLTWMNVNLPQVINVFSIVNVQIQKHPSSFRLHGILLPPASKTIKEITKTPKKKKNKKKNGPSKISESQN